MIMNSGNGFGSVPPERSFGVFTPVRSPDILELRNGEERSIPHELGARVLGMTRVGVVAHGQGGEVPLYSANMVFEADGQTMPVVLRGWKPPKYYAEIEARGALATAHVTAAELRQLLEEGETFGSHIIVYGGEDGPPACEFLGVQTVEHWQASDMAARTRLQQ